MVSVSTERLGGGDTLAYEIIDGRRVRISTNTDDIEYSEDRLRIDNKNIKVGDSLNLEVCGLKLKYKVSYIQQLSSTTFLISSHIRTKATEFLLPLLGGSRENFAYNVNLINCYIRTNNNLVLQFRYLPIDKFIKIEKLIDGHPRLVRTNCYSSTIVKEFKNPETEIVSLFREGKYSQFPKEYKEQILKFHGYKEDGKMARILGKDDKFRNQLELDLGVEIPKDMDLFSKPIWEQEIWRDEKD